MKVRFYYRHPNKLNRSIERVFECISSGLERNFGIMVDNSFAKTFRVWPLSMCYNMLRMGLKSRKKGINHITGDIHYVALLMPRNRTVLTVHDLVSIHNQNVNSLFRLFVYYLWYYFPLKHLKHITCISEATRQDLIRNFPFAEDKITVIPNPISDEFAAMEPASNIKPVILHIGTRSNKNLERVIKALAPLDCHLRIIGQLSDSQVRLLQETEVVYSNAFGISDEDMIKEYQNCDIVSFPSLFEGFGMPIIEAQACGRPVVTSDLEPMRSVSGGGAVLVDPESEDSIRQGFSSLIEKPAMREALIAKGLKNAEIYTSKTISKEYKVLYDRILH